MLLAGTLAVLALWLIFVWFFDPDGFREAGVNHTERLYGGCRH